MSKILHGLDAVSGGALLLMVVLAPWMLGTTTQETIAVLNGAASCLAHCGLPNVSSAVTFFLAGDQIR